MNLLQRRETCMKKMIPFALMAALAGTAITAPIASAEGEIVTNVNEQTEQQSQFLKLTGTIGKLEDRTSGGLFTMLEGENPFGLYIDDKTRVFDNTGKEAKVKEGDKFTAYVNKNKPMILIYPPQYTPEVIIVETDAMGTAQVGKFDKNFLDETLQLKLNLADDTPIENLAGDALTAKDIVGKEVLGFYSVTTRSIPAQTAPEKVVLLEVVQSPLEAVQHIIDTDFYDVKGVKMVPLRLIAEQLGYTIKSTGTGAIVSKGAISYTITRGTTTYGYNKALRQFEEAPALLEKNKTYVPVQFFEEIVQ